MERGEPPERQQLTAASMLPGLCPVPRACGHPPGQHTQGREAWELRARHPPGGPLQALGHNEGLPWLLPLLEFQEAPEAWMPGGWG